MRKAIFTAMILAVAPVSAANASTANMDIVKDVITDGATNAPPAGNEVHTFDAIMFGTPIMLTKDQKLKLSIRFGTVDLFGQETLHSLKLDRGTNEFNKESLKMKITGTDLKVFAWELTYKLRDKSTGRYDRATQASQTGSTTYERDKDNLILGMGELNIGMLILEFTNKDDTKLSISKIEIALDAKSISKDTTQPIYVPVPASGLMMASLLGLGWGARRLRRTPARGTHTPYGFGEAQGARRRAYEHVTTS